jgi:exosortase
VPKLPFSVGRSVTSVPFRLALVVGATALAYRFSLSTMLDGWTYQSPQGDLALVPPIAVALLVAASLRHRHVGAVRLGRIDVALAVLFSLVAAAGLIVAPVATSSYYWTLRPDMLTLPLVAAAGIALFFGARALFGFIFPLLFLFLAWPLPYSVLLENALSRVTAATVASVALVNRVTGVAQSEGDGLFRLHHAGQSFDVSVASACSGIDSLIGFAIVGIAALYVVTGPIHRRALWLLAGLVAVWAGNVVRITSILVVARAFGQQAALEWLHPVLGLVVINIVAVSLWLALPRFGLRARSLFTPAVSDTPIGRMVPEAERATPRAILGRGAVFALVALGLGVADGQLSGIAAAFANGGLPAVVSFDSRPIAGPQWRVHPVRTITWAKTYFGPSSTWQRFHLTPASPGRQALTAWVDAIDTPDLAALAAHPVIRCYDFHNEDVLVNRSVVLDHGVVGHDYVYRANGGGVWHALTWEWPVTWAGGRVAYERIVILASSDLIQPVGVRAPHGNSLFADSILSVLGSFSSGNDPNPALSRSVMGVAESIIDARLEART